MSFSNNFVENTDRIHRDIRSIVNTFLLDKERIMISTTSKKAIKNLKHQFSDETQLMKVKSIIGKSKSSWEYIAAIEFALTAKSEAAIKFVHNEFKKWLKENKKFTATIPAYLFYKIVNLCIEMQSRNSTNAANDLGYFLQEKVEKSLKLNDYDLLPGNIDFSMNYTELFEITNLLNDFPPEFDGGNSNEDLHLMESLFKDDFAISQLRELRNNGLHLEYLPLFEKLYYKTFEIGKDTDHTNLSLSQRKNLKRGKTEFLFNDAEDEDDDDGDDEDYDNENAENENGMYNDDDEDNDDYYDYNDDNDDNDDDDDDDDDFEGNKKLKIS
jgi:hypothetical protein